MKKFADDGQIDRTINSIYVFENKVSCCTELSSIFFNLMSINFSVSVFHSPTICKGDRYFSFQVYLVFKLCITSSIQFIIPPSCVSSANFISSAFPFSSLWLIKTLVAKMRSGD